MSQSVLNMYPVSRRCCHCMSLKVGTVIIAVAGILPSVILILLYEVGTFPFEKLGVTRAAADTILHIYAVLGVLLCAVHVVLLTAAVTYNENLILLYLWTCIVYICVDVVLVAAVAVYAVRASEYNFAVVYVICQLIYWFLIVTVVLPVVNGFRQSIHTVVIMIS